MAQNAFILRKLWKEKVRVTHLMANMDNSDIMCHPVTVFVTIEYVSQIIMLFCENYVLPTEIGTCES